MAVAVAPKWVKTAMATSHKEETKMAFKEVKIEELSFNPFTKISKEWMLITAGDEEKHNTMTASWGGVGIMWGDECGNSIYSSTEIYEGIRRCRRYVYTFFL